MEIISPSEYVDLLLCSNNLKYNPLHQICNYGDTATLTKYLNTLKWCLKDSKLGNILSREKIEELLLEFTKTGYSILHLAAMPQNQGFIKELKTFINEVFNKAQSSFILGELLHKKSSNGYLPSSKKFPKFNCLS